MLDIDGKIWPGASIPVDAMHRKLFLLTRHSSPKQRMQLHDKFDAADCRLHNCTHLCISLIKFINNYIRFFSYFQVFTSVYSRWSIKTKSGFCCDRDASQILKARVAKQRLRYAGDYLPIYGAFCKFR